MKNRMSGLEQMRAARDQREAVVTAPWKARVALERGRADQAIEAHKRFERTVGTEIAKRTIEAMQYEMGAHVGKHFKDIAGHAVFQQYARERLMAPSVRTMSDPVNYRETVIEFSVPSFHLRRRFVEMD